MEYEERIAVRRQTFKKILDACSWYTVEDLQELVPDVGEGMKELLDTWEGSHRIFSVQGKKGRLYPQFEFDQNYQPLSIIYDVLSALQENDELAIAGWFVFKNESVATRRRQDGCGRAYGGASRSSCDPSRSEERRRSTFRMILFRTPHLRKAATERV
jgi:hypothetical protein